MMLMTTRQPTSADKPEVRGPIRCHVCRLIYCDAEHYLSHKCEHKLLSDEPTIHGCPASLDSPPPVSDCTESTDSQNGKYRMKPSGRYVVSFQAEHFYKGRRYHWMICSERKLDELVSWGHEPTQELAETAARDEVINLSAGLSHGGQVASTTKAFTIADSRHSFRR